MANQKGGVGKIINLSDALEDVRIAILQLEFSIKLLSYCKLEKMDPQEFDTDHMILLEGGDIRLPKGNFSDKDNIVRAAGVYVSLAFGASALVMDKAYEAADINPDPLSNDNWKKIRNLVFMVRCAYAHGIAEPKWKAQGEFKRTISIEVHDQIIKIDLQELDGKTFDFKHLGGHSIWLGILEESLSVLRTKTLKGSKNLKAKP